MKQSNDDHRFQRDCIIGILMPFSSKTSIIFFKSLVQVMEKVFDKITLISTNLTDPFFSNFECIEIVVPTNKNSIMRIFYFLKIQLYSAFHIFRLRNKVQVVDILPWGRGFTYSTPAIKNS